MAKVVAQIDRNTGERETVDSMLSLQKTSVKR